MPNGEHQQNGCKCFRTVNTHKPRVGWGRPWPVAQARVREVAADPEEGRQVSE